MYGNLTDVFTGIETFQLTFDYFEVHFEIFGTTNGIIGTGDIRKIGFPQTPNSPTPNLSINDISPALIPGTVSKRLPNSPFRWPPKDAPIKLTFTAFGPDISDKDVLTCYVSAANYALRNIKTHGDITIPADIVLYWTLSYTGHTVTQA
ncbi:MAG: hypothetical protein Q9226_009439 [Calogaya cf. arnoldii]